MSKLAQAIEQFDLEAYVEDHCGPIVGRVDFGTELRAYCPFCPSSDPDTKGKFYINVEKRTVFCQRCKYGHGVSMIQFIADLEGVTRTDVIRRLIDSMTHGYGSLQQAIDRLYSDEVSADDGAIIVRSVQLPRGSRRLFQGSQAVLMERAETYLRNRGVTDAQIQKHKFYLGCKGKFRNRVIIPAYDHGELVHWVARSIDGREPKYLTPANSNQSLWFFNWDNIKDKRSVVVVEGVFDALAVERAGFEVVASFGKELSKIQASRLSLFDEVVILYDSGATKYAYKAAELVRPMPCRVGILGDPDEDLDPDEVDRNILSAIISQAPKANSPEGVKQYIRHIK